jgi:hypothetical protein
MNRLSQLQTEFLKVARKWDDLSLDEQKAYLKRHPKSRRKITAKPEGKKVKHETAKPGKHEVKRYGPGRLREDEPTDSDKLEQFEKLKKELPEDQKQFAKYLVSSKPKKANATRVIGQVYKGKPIIKSEFDWPSGDFRAQLNKSNRATYFEVPVSNRQVITSVNTNWVDDEADKVISQCAAFKSIETAKEFIDNQLEFERKADIRDEIKGVSEKIKKLFESTLEADTSADEGPVASYWVRSISDRLARAPREDLMGAEYGPDGKLRRKYVAEKGRSYKLTPAQQKLISDVVGSPESKTVEQLTEARDNLDKFVDDLRAVLAQPKTGTYAYDMGTEANRFIASVDQYKKAIDTVIPHAKLMEKLVELHETETKDDIKLPEGYNFADTSLLGAGYGDIIIRSDDGNTELSFSMLKPNESDWSKYEGEVFYKVPGKSGVYTLGRTGVDSGIFTSWNDPLTDVNKMIAERIAEVEKHRSNILGSVSVPVGDGSWHVNPERLEKMKSDLTAGKTLTFAPHGFGTGYYLSAKPSRYSKPASDVTNEAFGGMRLFYDTYDAD